MPKLSFCWQELGDGSSYKFRSNTLARDCAVREAYYILIFYEEGQVIATERI